MNKFFKKFNKSNQQNGSLIYKDVTLYRYELETGKLKTYPQVYIYQSKENPRNFYAVGIQYIVSAKNKRDVSQYAAQPYYTAAKKDILLWAKNLDFDYVKSILRNAAEQYCEKQLQECYLKLQNSRKIYNNVFINFYDNNVEIIMSDNEINRCLQKYIYQK